METKHKRHQPSKKIFSTLLTSNEHAKLSELARLSGCSRGAVLRGFILHETARRKRAR